MDTCNRTKTEKRDARLLVMSGGYELFKTRRSNLAKRDRLMARDMRWAGEEATFCIAQFKATTAWDTRQREAREHIAASQADMIARMTDEQRDGRIRAILSEIELLPYRAGMSINGRAADLQRELDMLFEASRPEVYASAVTHLELVESLAGRLEPSSRLTELRERVRLHAKPHVALALAVAAANTTQVV